MNFYRFLIELIISFLLVNKCHSISENDITPIKLAKLENNIIKEESTLFTSENFPTFKFFKIDFNSLNEASEENHFSFIKISVQLKNEYSYKSFLLYINKTLTEFTNSTASYNSKINHPRFFCQKSIIVKVNSFTFLFKEKKTLNFYIQ